MTRPGSRREPRALAAELRQRGRSGRQIAATLRDRYNVNALPAARLAHGWSQADTASAWCAHWPDDPKTFKNISYWENWPGPTGHAPSLAVLDRLAQLYTCDVADLLAGWGEHGTSLTDPGSPVTEPETLAWQVQHLALPELTRTIADWSRRLPSPDRRNLLLTLSTAASFAASSAGLHGIPRRRAITGAAQLTGTWASRYWYHSTSRAQDLLGEHTVDLRLDHGRLVGRSRPHPAGSELDLALTVEGSVLTGTWTERTSPRGHYRAATFHGLIQLVVDPTAYAMNGMWLGVSKRYTIKAGDWRLARAVDDAQDPVTSATRTEPSENSPAITIANNPNIILPT